MLHTQFLNNMKAGKLLLMLFFYLFYSIKAFSYSDPQNWSYKKQSDINLITDFIAEREKYSETCYKDGHGWSVGFGDFALCELSIKVLRWQHKHLKNKSDDYVRSLVKISKPVAKWRLKIYIIKCYENLEKIEINGKSVTDILDSKQILSLIDNIYTRGETKFYKDELWLEYVKPYLTKNKINCVKVAHAFLKQSQYSYTKQRDGVLSRRLYELLDFTHKSCTYDVKFLVNTLQHYRTIK